MREGAYVREEYEEALFSIYGRDSVERALRILEGEAFLIDVTLHHEYHTMLEMYDRLGQLKLSMV